MKTFSHFMMLLLLTVSSVFSSQSSVFYKELNFIGGYSGEEGWMTSHDELMNSVGFEFLDKFSNEFGDYLTLDIQARLTYDFDQYNNPDDAAAFGLHNAWADYKIGLNKTLRVGHFDPQFGLEPVLDTHATLLQTLAMRDIGYKQDWGVGYRSGLGAVDYGTALQMGTGMGLDRDQNTCLATFRLSNPPAGGLLYGVSFLYGLVPEMTGMTLIPAPETSEMLTRKKRIGLDVQYPAGPVNLRAEVTAGKNGDQDVIGALADLIYVPGNMDNVELILQVSSWSEDPSVSSQAYQQAAISAQYRISSSWTIRAGLFDLFASPEEEDVQGVLQLYYFGKGS